MTTPTRKDTEVPSRTTTFRPELYAYLCVEVPSFRRRNDVVGGVPSPQADDLATTVGDWLETARFPDDEHPFSTTGYLILRVATEIVPFPPADTSEVHRIRDEFLQSLPTLPGAGPVPLVKRHVPEVPGTRIHGWFIEDVNTMDFTTCVALTQRFLGKAQISDAFDLHSCYELLRRVRPETLRQGRRTLQADDADHQDAPTSKDSSFWRDHVRPESNPWTSVVQTLIASLPEDSEARNQEVVRLDVAYRQVIAGEVARQIGELFRGQFDENGRPVETFEEMQVRSAIARQLLSEHQLAMVSPRTGHPCHPFAKQGQRRAQYTLQPLGGRASGTDWKLSAVAEALLCPQLMRRPDQYVRSSGR